MTSDFPENSDLVRSIAAELRSAVAGARTLTAMRSLSLPTVDMLLKETGSDRDDLPAVIVDATAALSDPLYRAAAHDLFPLPYTDAGWPKLAARGKRAADRFGIGYDSFRRGNESRPSRMDELMSHIALSLISVLDGQPSVAQVSADIDDTAPREDHPDVHARPAGRGRKRPFRIAIALAVVVLLGVVVVRDGDDGAGRPVPDGCTDIGLLADNVRHEPGAEKLAGRLRSVFANAGGETTVGCAAGPAYRWQSLVAQEMVLAGVPNGALLVSPNGVDVFLNRAAWGSYHQLGGKDGDAVQAMGGLVVRVVEYTDAHVEIVLSTGTVLVAERLDAPYFWIPSPYVPWWRSHPELGLPTSNPLASSRQEFRHGIGSVNPSLPGDPVALVVERPEDELPTLEMLRGRLLRQSDATAWFVDADGRRLWVPDGTTWDCLGGEARLAARDLPGYSVSMLPFGGPAHCPH